MIKHNAPVHGSTRGMIARFRPSRLSAAVAVLALSACASLQPDPMVPRTMKQATDADAATIAAAIEPIRGQLSLPEAVARALKYNLDARVKRMDEALALGQVDTASFDMLPKLAASAGYTWRDSDKSSFGSSDPAFQPGATRGNVPSISTDRTHRLGGLDMTWSLLDLGMGYYGTRQQADRSLAMLERRRKAAQLLVQDVRTAFYRAMAAQLLKDDVRGTVALAEEALAESRTVEAQRLRNPIDSLRYQRQLLENLRLLEAINQELVSANIDLAQLINAPRGAAFTLVERPARDVGAELLPLPVEKLEGLTLANNPDLRETHYNARIARDEVRRVMAKLFPNISLNWGLKYDSDSYLVDNRWQEAGLQLSFNLFNLFTGPAQIRLAEAGVDIADHRRMAMHASALTQMHLARIGLMSARDQFIRADTIWAVDKRIADLVRNRGDAQAQSKLDIVSNSTTATLSLLRRYQALTQVQAAENRLLATMGVDPLANEIDKMTIADATQQIAYQFTSSLERLIGLEPLPPLAPGAAFSPARFPVFPLAGPPEVGSPRPAAPMAAGAPAAPVVAQAASQPVPSALVPRSAELPATRPASAPAAAPAAAATAPAAVVAAAPAASASATDAATAANRVRVVLQGWAQAWAARDMDAYIAFYAPDFKGSFKTRDAWLKSRDSRIAKRKNVEVSLSDIDVVVDGKRATATFKQKYRSEVLRDETRRTMELRDIGGRWLITEESDR